MLSRTIQRILGLVLVLGVVVAGGGNTPANVSPVVRWALVSAIAVAGIVGGLLVWRSRTRTKLVELERQSEALAAQVRASDELRAVQAEELDAQAGDLAAAERERIYAELLEDVTNGLHDVLRNGGASGDEQVRFVEDNSLKVVSDTFAAELTDRKGRPRIEMGIAVKTSSGFRVTHASGPYTDGLKDPQGCFAVSGIEEVLARKAAAAFVRDGWYVVPLTDTHPLQYLFMLSTVPPQDPERTALKQHAALIKVTVAALKLVGGED